MLGDQLLAALVLFGLPVLFGVIVFAAIGLPLPASLLVIAAGSFVEQGAFDPWWVMGLAWAAAIVGDNAGYSLGRWGGRRLLDRLVRWAGGDERLRKLELSSARWGGLGIFFTRWLLPPLGPAINLTSGIAAYPWPSFLFFESFGALLWVLIYTTIGRLFSDRVQAMSDLLGNVGWAIIGGLAAIILGWRLLHYLRRHPPQLPDRAHTDMPDDAFEPVPTALARNSSEASRRQC